MRKVTETNNLNAQYPEISSEWDYQSNFPKVPADYLPGSSTVVNWICSKNAEHKYSARISNRVYKGNNCPFCAGKKIIAGINDLLSQNPVLASQWDYDANYPITPQQVFAHSGKAYNWICPFCDNRWSAPVANRAAGRGCGRCHQMGISFPEEAVFYYVSMAYADALKHDTSLGYSADIYIPSIHTVIEYDGIYYHSGQTKLDNDRHKDELCKSKGIRVIRFRDPQLKDTSPGVDRITCKDGDEKELTKALRVLFALLTTPVIPDINVRRDYYDIYARVLKYRQQNSVMHTHPFLAAEWDTEKNMPVKIQMISAGMRFDAWWKCQYGHSWRAKVYSRARGNGCPVCGRKDSAINRSKTAVQKNNLAMKYPKIAEEWDQQQNGGLLPSQVAAGSDRKYYWICANGHDSYPASIPHRVQGNGCPLCGRVKSSEAACRAVICIQTQVIYKSLEEAGAAYGGNKKNIANACGKPHRTAYKMHWDYADGNGSRTRNKNKIRNIDTGEVFVSIIEAARQYRCDRSTISGACRGKTKTACGCHWEYVTETKE